MKQKLKDLQIVHRLASEFDFCPGQDMIDEAMEGVDHDKDDLLRILKKYAGWSSSDVESAVFKAVTSTDTVHQVGPVTLSLWKESDRNIWYVVNGIYNPSRDCVLEGFLWATPTHKDIIKNPSPVTAGDIVCDVDDKRYLVHVVILNEKQL